MMPTHQTNIVDLIAMSEDQVLSASLIDKGLFDLVQKLSESEQVLFVQKDPENFHFLDHPFDKACIAFLASSVDFKSILLKKKPTTAVQLAIVRQNGLAIKHLKDPEEEVQIAAVRQDGRAVKYLKEPGEAIQLAAVRQTAYAIQRIKNPSEAVQLAAVRHSGMVLQHIQDPSEAVQLAAVRQCGWSADHIQNPSPAVLALITRQSGQSSKEEVRRTVPGKAVSR